METSKEIIEQAKKRFKELKHKKYDEPSFFAGFLEAKAINMKKDFVKSIPIYHIEEQHINRWYEGLQIGQSIGEIRKDMERNVCKHIFGEEFTQLGGENTLITCDKCGETRVCD